MRHLSFISYQKKKKEKKKPLKLRLIKLARENQFDGCFNIAARSSKRSDILLGIP